MLRLIFFLCFSVKYSNSAGPQVCKTGSYAEFVVNYPEEDVDTQEWRLVRHREEDKPNEILVLSTYSAETKSFKTGITTTNRFLCDVTINAITLCYMTKMLQMFVLQAVTTLKGDKKPLLETFEIKVSDDTNYDPYNPGFVREYHLVFKPHGLTRYCDDIKHTFYYLGSSTIFLTAILHRVNPYLLQYYELPLERLENQEHLKLKINKDELVVSKMQTDQYGAALVFKHEGLTWLRTYPPIQYQDPVEIISMTTKKIEIKIHYGNNHHLQLLMSLPDGDAIVMETLVHHGIILIDDQYVSSATAQNDVITIKFDKKHKAKFTLIGMYGYQNQNVFYKGKTYDNSKELNSIPYQQTESQTDAFSGFRNVKILKQQSLIGRPLTSQDTIKTIWLDEISRLYEVLTSEDDENESILEEELADESPIVDQDHQRTSEDTGVPPSISIEHHDIGPIPEEQDEDEISPTIPTGIGAGASKQDGERYDIPPTIPTGIGAGASKQNGERYDIPPTIPAGIGAGASKQDGERYDIPPTIPAGIGAGASKPDGEGDNTTPTGPPGGAPGGNGPGGAQASFTIIYVVSGVAGVVIIIFIVVILVVRKRQKNSY